MHYIFTTPLRPQGILQLEGFLLRMSKEVIPVKEALSPWIPKRSTLAARREALQPQLKKKNDTSAAKKDKRKRRQPHTEEDESEEELVAGNKIKPKTESRRSYGSGQLQILDLYKWVGGTKWEDSTEDKPAEFTCRQCGYIGPVALEGSQFRN
ncbi:hypothetical protein BT69DRAFT_1291613 [Atractiella rhizophila]|nr:hypothetical protein BT69DRAFT_1291613 [Atractiella rhizophila]